MNRWIAEFIVGIFIIIAFSALLFLAFRVSGFTHAIQKDSYPVTATFDNIGSLKVRAPVTIAGVKVGEVVNIGFDPQTYQAVVKMYISHDVKIPQDTSANILTAGLLGANYVGLTVGYSEKYLTSGEQIKATRSALVLENLISQLLFNVSKTK